MFITVFYNLHDFLMPWDNVDPLWTSLYFIYISTTFTFPTRATCTLAYFLATKEFMKKEHKLEKRIRCHVVKFSTIFFFFFMVIILRSIYLYGIWYLYNHVLNFLMVVSLLHFQLFTNIFNLMLLIINYFSNQKHFVVFNHISITYIYHQLIDACC